MGGWIQCRCKRVVMRGAGDQLSIGERIAFYRHRRGLSWVVLANLVGRTEDWLSKIERGEREVGCGGTAGRGGVVELPEGLLTPALSTIRCVRLRPGRMVGACFR